MQFFESDQIPLPPAEIRIEDVTIEPLPGGKRIRIMVTITPFQEKPDLHLEIRDADGELLVTSSVIETAVPKLALTLHLRREPGSAELQLAVVLGYPDGEPVDERQIPFTIHAHPVD